MTTKLPTQHALFNSKNVRKLENLLDGFREKRVYQIGSWHEKKAENSRFFVVVCKAL